MKHYLKLLAFTAILLLGIYVGAFAQAEINSRPTDSLDAFLLDKMKSTGTPGLQLAVIKNGKIVKLAHYGIANIQDSIPVTDQTIFTINSITKAFVGVAVMQLVEEGKLDLAKPVSFYLDSLPVAWQSVMVRQLLTHNSGIPNIMNNNTGALVVEGNSAAWAKVKTLPMEFKTGEHFNYSQTNYLLVGMIIDKLCGESFSSFIKERQFDVADMPLSGFYDSHDVVLHSARGYTYFRSDDGIFRRTNKLGNVFEEFPTFLRTAAGINSSAAEIAKWVIALQNGRLLKEKSSLQTLWTPGRLNNGSTAGFSQFTNGYAIGWPAVIRSEHPAMAPIGGGRSAVFVYPQDDLAVIVLTNLQGSNPENFVDEIAGYYIPEMRAANGFGLPPNIKLLRKELLKRGFEQAPKVVKEEKKKNPNYQLSENEVNDWGYTLLGQGKQKEALEIFKLNVVLYPKSANTYDSLGEIYADMDNKALAIVNYKQSLKLNPQNSNAAEQLKKLE